MLAEEPSLAHYAKDRENFVTNEASQFGVGITLSQKQSHGEIKLIAFCSRYLKEHEKSNSIGELKSRMELRKYIWGFLVPWCVCYNLENCD